MNAAMLLLQHAAGVIEHRERSYGPPRRHRRALVAGAGRSRHPGAGGLCDVAGYAACLREVTRDV